MQGLELGRFAREKAARLIDRLEERMEAAAVAGADEESVHHLRTSIRRLSECLRTFEEVFPGKNAKQLRRKLGKLMDRAAEVRNRDIAGALFAKAGVSADDPLLVRLESEKVVSRHALLDKLDRLRDGNRPDDWRGYLQ